MQRLFRRRKHIYIYTMFPTTPNHCSVPGGAFGCHHGHRFLFFDISSLFPSFLFLYHSQGDATYLMVTEENKIQDYGLSAICTHLGCIVPWNKAENKFICPCHNSQYDPTGKVCDILFPAAHCHRSCLCLISSNRKEDLFPAVRCLSRPNVCRL